jgi:IS1 family transposase
METLDAFDKRFPTEESCREALRDARWANGVRCPKCDTDKVYALKAKPFYWLCRACGNYRFSVISGTIFENTKKPLKIWFKVAYLMLVAKKSRSALEIHRTIFGEESGSDYHTTWYMCTRLRAAMRNKEWGKLMGVVEVDETYIGGKDRNRHWGKKSAQRRKAAGPRTGLEKAGASVGYGKVGVIGAIERKGNVVCKIIGDADAETLSGFVRKTVSEKVDLVATDENPSYNYIDRRIDHQAVKHGAGEYVRGEVHTNNIESFWSLLKRGVIGSFHHVSKGYLPLYLAEFTFRHNHRKHPDVFGELLSRC